MSPGTALWPLPGCSHSPGAACSLAKTWSLLCLPQVKGGRWGEKLDWSWAEARQVIKYSFAGHYGWVNISPGRGAGHLHIPSGNSQPCPPVGQLRLSPQPSRTRWPCSQVKEKGQQKSCPVDPLPCPHTTTVRAGDLRRPQCKGHTGLTLPSVPAPRDLSGCRGTSPTLCGLLLCCGFYVFLTVVKYT